IEIARHILALVILEQLGVGPLHAAVGQKLFRRFERAAQSFEQKKCFGKFLANSRLDVLPDLNGNFVAGIATKPIYATTTPNQKRLGNFLPQLDEIWIQFDQVAPNISPRAGTGKSS